MGKVINILTREEYKEEIIIPLTYNRALDETDYVLWKARQRQDNNITILNNKEEEDDDMDMHYNDLLTDVDKIVHALIGALEADIYCQVMVEYTEKYGEELMYEAINELKTTFKETYNRYR